MVDTRPLLPVYLVASVAAAAVSMVVYAYLYMVGVAQPRLATIYVVPIVYDRVTIAAVTGAVSATLLPIYLYARRMYRWLERVREQSRDFLLLFSGLVETTESVYEALMIASRMVGKPLSILVEYMARHYRLTGDLEEAFRRAFSSAPRDVRLLMSSIVVAARGGGRMEEIVVQAANYSNELRRFHVLVESRLAEYTAIVALGSVTFSFTAAVILKLLKVMEAAQVPFMAARMPPLEVLTASFYYAMLILTVLSSVVVGKVIKGYTPLAAKYIMFLLPVNTAILYLLPDYLPG